VVDAIRLFPEAMSDWACADDACKAMLLGLYTMHYCSMRFAGKRLDKIEHPFNGVSIEKLCSKLPRSIKIPVWFSTKDDKSSSGHACDLQAFVASVGRVGEQALMEDGSA
jgi:hypothetical protein